MRLTTVNAQGGSTGHGISGSRAFRSAMGAAMSDFLAAYPDYAASPPGRPACYRYSYLGSGAHVYLVYTGAGLVSDAQLRPHVERLRGGCFGDPHSESPASAASTLLIEQARQTVLRLLQRRRGGVRG